MLSTREKLHCHKHDQLDPFRDQLLNIFTSFFRALNHFMTVYVAGTLPSLSTFLAALIISFLSIAGYLLLANRLFQFSVVARSERNDTLILFLFSPTLPALIDLFYDKPDFHD